MDFSYDIECYPNFFSLCATLDNEKTWEFEISQWKDDSFKLHLFLLGLKEFGHRMTGFNNVDYDYMLVHLILENNGVITYQELYSKSQAYFDDPNFGYKNEHTIPEWNHLIPQIDLYKIHHFDNAAKRTSLKIIEFNMMSDTIEDLPYPAGTVLTYEQSRVVLKYNHHDVSETEKFRVFTKPMIEFRDSLSEKHKKDFTNFSDPKIGATFIEMELDKIGIHKKLDDGIYNQTFRDEIKINEIILPYIKFDRPEFNEILNYFRSSTIDEFDISGLLALKGFFNKVSCNVDGFDFAFGAGGIHGSIKRSIVRKSATHDLLDWDVSSFYPNLSIVNEFYPEHLTKEFCKIYKNIYMERKKHGKKTPINAMLKLALNSAYGNSSSVYSMMLDQKFTMSITINGQLLLCMLAEKLMAIPDLKMVQINTDGLTILCPKIYRPYANEIWKNWEALTKLELEEAEYDAMFIRDVNSYMAKYSSGGVKRIGCYAYETAMENPATRELSWHKNQGQRIVAMSAEAALVYNKPIDEFIKNHKNYDDFYLRTKVPKSSKLVLRTPNSDEQLQSVTRYYVSKSGGELIKIMPHTTTQLNNWLHGDHYEHEDTGERQVVKSGGKPKSGKFKPVDKEKIGKIPPREIRIQSGLNCSECNSKAKLDPLNIDFDYYIEETEKIVFPLLLGE